MDYTYMDYTERYVSTFYDNLAQGKLVGQKCNTCHGYQVFPSPCCRHCQSRDLQYVDFSMKGNLLYVFANYMAEPRFMNSGLYPMAFGAIQCEEGPMLYIPVLEGIDINNWQEENQRCPLEVYLETREIGGSCMPVAKVGKKQSG